MQGVVKRKSAERDLIEQWLWYAENVDIETADRFLSATESTVQMLSRQPEIGVRVFTTLTELQGMRRFPVTDGFEKILIFYFPLIAGMDLVRIIYSSRDLKRVLDEGFFG
jgi:toxin ParE1/3/4